MVNLSKLCQHLRQKPLLHLSLGSKELSHSNLLAWMCQQFPAESVRVLAPWLREAPSCEDSEVQREHKHLDLGFRVCASGSGKQDVGLRSPIDEIGEEGSQALRHHGRVADGVRCGGAQIGVFPQLEAVLIEVWGRSVGGSSLLTAICQALHHMGGDDGRVDHAVRC